MLFVIKMGQPWKLWNKKHHYATIIIDDMVAGTIIDEMVAGDFIDVKGDEDNDYYNDRDHNDDNNHNNY